jgi:hypothetical protein
VKFYVTLESDVSESASTAGMRLDWEVDERMPRYDDIREFEVWLSDGSVRTVRRVGGKSNYYTPGTLVFLDCTHPMQNALCDEDRIMGWRHNGKIAEVLQQDYFASEWLSQWMPNNLAANPLGHWPDGLYAYDPFDRLSGTRRSGMTA